ncbi:MAG TPA: glycosyltransferase family 4 protein [bacterium]|nr:glycosyltransferase family 4 protein [bacterium]
MTILFITGNWGGPANGIDRYIIETARLLAAQGHTCQLVYSREKGPWMSGRIPFSSVHQVRGLQQPPDAAFPKAADDLEAAILACNPDLCFFHSIYHHQALSRMAGLRPAAGMLHDYVAICLKDTRRYYFSRRLCQAPLGMRCLWTGHFIRKPLSGRRLPRLMNLATARQLLDTLKTMPTLITASQAVKKAYLQNGFSSERIQVLPLFVSPPALNMQTTYPREKRVLFVGRLTDRYKGADVLLRAAGRCREQFSIDIVGGGAFLPRLQTLAHKLGLNDRVCFHGWARPEEVPGFYQKASVLAMPSLWAEPFGLVGVEALANGTPVVAFDVGGIREWLSDDRTGFLVPYADEKKMAEKIDLLIADPDRVKEMGQAGRRSVEELFSPKRHLVALLDVFNQCCIDWLARSKTTGSS